MNETTPQTHPGSSQWPAALARPPADEHTARLQVHYLATALAGQWCSDVDRWNHTARACPPEQAPDEVAELRRRVEQLERLLQDLAEDTDG